MCLTLLDPILSATNSTVRRSEGGWLWKKACSRSTCHIEEFYFLILHSQCFMYLLKIKNLSIGLACSFCCDLLAAGASLGSAEVGVIFRMIPPLLAVLPDTNAARSLRNSPGTMMMKKKGSGTSIRSCYFVAHLWWTLSLWVRCNLCSLAPN